MAIAEDGLGSGGGSTTAPVVNVSQYPNAAALSDSLANPTTTQIGANNLLYAGGATWSRWSSANNNSDGVAGLQVGAVAPWLFNGSTFDRHYSRQSYRGTSGTNASNAQTLFLANLHDTLAIVMTTSAGTATLKVEGSVDNSNWVDIDDIAAAASTAKQYTATTVGATTAISFAYIRITAGAAGAGNTTTMTITAK